MPKSHAGFSILLLTPIALAQTPQWRQHVQPIPGLAPSSPALACDHLRDRIVLFGGVSGHVPLNATMELDGDVWSVVTSATPPPSQRYGSGMVFDSRRGECVLFGGVTFGTVFAETWTWNGTAWTQRSPQHSPPGGFGSLVFDEARDVAVWYDGSGTWEWDGTDWQQRASLHTPSARAFVTTAYDSRRGRTVMFGGLDPLTQIHLDDTWEWDGTDWQQSPAVFPLVPGPRYSLMAFDRERARCVLLGTTPGGTTPGAFVCYEFDGAAWTAAPAPPTNGGIPVYDRQRGRIVYPVGTLIGSNYSGTTWSYEVPGLAVAQPYGIGCGSLAVHENAAARPLLGATLSVDIGHAPTGLAFMCFGWSNRQALGLALPAHMDVFGLTHCWLLQSDDAITLPCVSTGPTTARYDFAIPAWQSLVGLRFFLQPWAPAPGANPAGAAIGDGLAVTIGAY
ncbi:MAG: hypothetical protein U1E73_02595 [Planctomycetota bacterium]